MKISHLFEDSREDLFERIMSSKYYQINFRPILQNTKDKELDDTWDTVRFSRSMLLHGTSGEGIKEYSFRYRSGSRDTNPYTHDLVNKLSKEKLGESIRNLMFVSTSESVASGYGTVTVVIPYNDYKVFYNPRVNDFTIDMYAASVNSADTNDKATTSYLIGKLQHGSHENDYDEFFEKFADSDNEDEYIPVFNKSFYYLCHRVFEKNEGVSQDKLTSYMKDMIEFDELRVDIERIDEMATYVYRTFVSLKNEYDADIENYVDHVKTNINPKVEYDSFELMCHPGDFVLMTLSVFKEFIYYAKLNDPEVNK